MAARARANTLFGGCSALTFAKRLERMGSKIDHQAVVSAVYSRSSGKHHQDLEAWECPECGQVYLGQDNAAACCAQEEGEES